MMKIVETKRALINISRLPNLSASDFEKAIPTSIKIIPDALNILFPDMAVSWPLEFRKSNTN